MLCLGIESTAHTFGIGIVKWKGAQGKNSIVLANVRDAYTTKKGGIIPSQASEHHAEVCDTVIKKALDKANVSLKNIDLISFSQGPGLGHTLRIGAMCTRSLALHNNIPLIGVNHCIAHLEIGNLMTKSTKPVLLYASGANTQIIAYEGGKYRIFGETLDNGVGNFIDSVAREMGLGFPGGPEIEKLAKKGKKLIPLPYTVKGMDVGFGGLYTNVKQKLHSGKYRKEDLAFSIQETVFAMLIEVSERALAHCDKKELLLGGGVCCNKRLQEMATIMCKERGAACYIPPRGLLVDNGAMIAWQGLVQYKSGQRMTVKDTQILPYERTDDVEVTWK